MKLTSHGMPRRNDVTQLTHTEIVLREAHLAVEAIGAHPLLTDASVLISQARNKLADYIELEDK